MSKLDHSLLPALLVAVLGVAGTGCNMGPQRSMRSYLDNLKLRNYRACYHELTHQDRADCSMERFLTDVPFAANASPEWFAEILRATDYELGTIRMEGKRAVATVKVTRPDLALWERTIDAALGADEMPGAIAQKSLTQGTYPKLTYDDEIVAVKDAHKWRIFVDFRARDEAMKKRAEAVRLYHRHEYDRAIAAYRALLNDLGREEATGNAGLAFACRRELELVEHARNRMRESRSYAAKLKLSDVAMKMSAARVPAIFGKISNRGDRAIDEVVCTVAYYGNDGEPGKPLYSEEHTVVATPIEFTNFLRPVLPFVPGETRNFGFTLTAPAEIQQRTNPRVEITASVFTQSGAPLPKLASGEHASSAHAPRAPLTAAPPQPPAAASAPPPPAR